MHTIKIYECCLLSNLFSSQQFFRLTNLRRLTISDNSIARIPPAIGQLAQLVELDLSKNGKELLLFKVLITLVP